MNEFNSLERRASLYTMQGMQQATLNVYREVMGLA